MVMNVDVIQSVLKLVQMPERQCFTSWQDLLRKIPELYAVEIPSGITNVSIGNAYPSSSETDHLWIQTDNSGNFIGLNIFVTGAWRQIYPLLDQLFLIVGDSRVPPSGYTVADSDPRIDDAMLNNLQKIWTLGGTTPIWYTVFHVTFTGW